MLPAFLVGVPVLALVLGLAHVLARVERARLALFTGVRVEGWTLPPGWRARLRCAGLWREVAYALVLLPVASVGMALVVATWAAGVALTLLPITSRGAEPGAGVTGEVPMVLLVAVGLALLLTAPWVAQAWVQVEVALVRALLGPRGDAELRARVEELTDTRERVVQAGDAERIRIERDLHDGAQQSLVSLAMSLGRARAKLDEDPAGARVLLDQAHGDAKRALAELRDLARGIHPAVLTDRGLDAALSALAARSPVPVSVHVEVPQRPSPTVEAVAYFVVAEALTNIAKHARARAAAVRVLQAGDRVYVTVLDDGVGGADLALGTGLAGLRDRVAAVDGRLALSSPSGGPTELTVELPCGR
jgi:signal transduction histidine kinase